MDKHVAMKFEQIQIAISRITFDNLNRYIQSLQKFSPLTADNLTVCCNANQIDAKITQRSGKCVDLTNLICCSSSFCKSGMTSLTLFSGMKLNG